LGNSARTRRVPALGGVGGAVGENEGDGLVGDAAAAPAHLGLGPEVVHLADGAVEPHAVEGGEGGEEGGLALAHELADGHLAGADQAGDGGADVAVAEVEEGGLDAGLGGEDAGFADLDGGLGVLEVLLRDGLLLDERLEAVDVLLVLAELGPGLGEGRLGRLHALAERAVIEAEERVALLHEGAVLVEDLLDEGLDAGADLDVLGGIELADGLGAQGDVGGADNGDLDHRRGQGGGGRLVASGGEPPAKGGQEGKGG